MAAEITPIRTAAETGLAEAFAALRGRLSAGPVTARREAAFRRFEALGLPHRRIEEWKYTDLRALMREAKPLAGPPDAAAIAKVRQAGLSFADLDCYRAVFVDGHFVPELSNLPVLEDKAIEVGFIDGPFASGRRHNGWRLERDHLDPNCVRQPMIDLNTAFVSQSLSVHVWNVPPPGRPPAKPVHVAHVQTSAKAQSAFSRLFVSTNDGNELDLIESFDDLSGAAHQTNAVTEIMVGDGAKVRRVSLNRESMNAFHVDSLIATLNSGAVFENLSMTTGGGVSRSDTYVDFAISGSKAVLGGVALLRGRQHADNTLLIDHQADHCRSRELFKSVLDEASRGVFQGKVIVRPGAQKTDARMMTRALLLSEDAEADNKPELEIFADDVECGHGATSGALDDNLKFYLMARGIPEKEAEALLIQSFVGEAVETVAHEGIRDALMQETRRWLEARP
jgi:Fe-S cluster assembly protein SufD